MVGKLMLRARRYQGVQCLKKEQHMPGTKKPFQVNGKVPVLWCEPGLNRRHMDFQSIALPTELSHHQSYLKDLSLSGQQK